MRRRKNGAGARPGPVESPNKPQKSMGSGLSDAFKGMLGGNAVIDEALRRKAQENLMAEAAN